MNHKSVEFKLNYTPIIGTLGYILSSDREKVLLVHRTGRGGDDHFGKYNGLGGHMEPDEDVATCMKREIREEAGVECVEIRLRGTINWTNFGPKGENWLVFIFLIEQFSGIPRSENEEGRLEWVEIGRMNELPMWEGDRHFLPLVFDEDPRIFHGLMPYAGDRSTNWSYRRL
jgi:8-oxo-dGTP diphosphatase